MNDVPLGYKQTELGIIPEDWNILAVGEISKVGRGRVISHREIAKSLNPQYPVFSSQTSNNGVMGYLDTYDFEGEYITWTTDGANAGTVFHRIGRFNCTNVCGTIQVSTGDAGFIARVLSKQAPSHVSRHLGNPKLMNDTMKRISVPLPPVHEQRAIASALADMDALLDSLEELLVKKRQLKQAAMQELLTGKKRLDGFEEDWEEVKLGNVVTVVSGGTPSTGQAHFWNGSVAWCTPTDLTSVSGKYLKSTARSITHEGMHSSAAILLPRGSILFCSRASVGEVKIAAIETTTNQGFQSFVCSKSVNNEFLYYLTILEKAKFIELAKGSTFLEVSSKAVKSVLLRLPLLPEQQAIAAILSDMDAEIDALEKRLAKTRDLKQGMMQELLTGRTRLV